MSLIERIEKVGDAKVWYDDIPIENEYTVGIAGERFLRTLKDRGVITGTLCPNCDLTYVPPSMYCERCFTQLDQWVEVPPTGVVETFTVLTRSLEGEPLDELQVLAVIRLEGAHGGLVHRLGEISPEEVEIGMAVEAVLKPASERQGSILDIEHFRPV
ncbi:MAG: Zn-ribbon domain-containing OB-fold protein [Anaerolineae bacterium]|nr:Zn-ribbon domain-containing OB-fold protein [Anaerolineae bacterium]